MIGRYSSCGDDLNKIIFIVPMNKFKIYVCVYDLMCIAGLDYYKNLDFNIVM